MIYLVNNINQMLVGEFETMAQVKEHLRGLSRFSVHNSYLIDGEKKDIKTSVIYRVDGDKPDTLPLEDYQEEESCQNNSPAKPPTSSP
jgi:hypothetical protein